MLYLFDLDNTLISGYMDAPDKAYDRWYVLPDRLRKLQELTMRGDKVAIITNQGGVAFGYVTKEQCDRKLNEVVRRLGLSNPRSSGDDQPPQVYCCVYDERGKPPFNDPFKATRRKPSGVMLLEAINDHRKAALHGVLYVGDRPEDEAAAIAAGVPFQWAYQFFSDPEACRFCGNTPILAGGICRSCDYNRRHPGSMIPVGWAAKGDG